MKKHFASLLLAVAALAAPLFASAGPPPCVADTPALNSQETIVSYSFGVRAATKAAALEAAAVKFDEVCASQPAHERDREPALQAAAAMVGLLADDANKDVSLTMSGWLSWQGADGPQVTGANLSTSASLVDRSS